MKNDPFVSGCGIISLIVFFISIVAISANKNAYIWLIISIIGIIYVLWVSIHNYCENEKNKKQEEIKEFVARELLSDFDFQKEEQEIRQISSTYKSFISEFFEKYNIPIGYKHERWSWDFTKKKNKS